MLTGSKTVFEVGEKRSIDTRIDKEYLLPYLFAGPRIGGMKAYLFADEVLP